MQVSNLLETWRNRAMKSQHAHYRTARHLSRRNLQFGLPSTILSAIIGTSLVVSFEQSPSVTMRVIFGLLSLLAAGLAAGQTFLRYAERAEKHRAAGAAFGSIRREIEQFQVVGSSDNDKINTFIDGIRNRFDELAANSPEISEKIWNEIEQITSNERPANV